MVHEVAAAGFSDSADYEAARPSYPPEAVAWFVKELGITPTSRVADVAAGTGKLTRLLASTGAFVFGVEPVPGMRATFRTVLPDTPLMASTAEALALRDASIDALLVAQAWHWFDHDRASREAARVVRRGGGLGLVWNARDRSVSWVDEVWSIMDRVEKHAPWRNHEEWRDSAARPTPGFSNQRMAQFQHEQQISPEGVVQRMASVSHVAVLPERERAEVLDEVRHVLATNPATAGRDVVAIPYRVDCFALIRD